MIAIIHFKAFKMYPLSSNQGENYTKTSKELYRRWEWYEPPKDSAPVHFCLDTSLHGLHYLGQRHRHFCERIFWSVAFVVAASCSAVLIWHMWNNYVTTPIITVFNPTEKTLDQIPFPAVTICNINNVRESKWQQVLREVEMGLNGGLSNETLLKGLASIHDIIQICLKDKTFTTKFRNFTADKPNARWVTETENRFNEYSHLLNPFGTLKKVSQSCNEMVIFCVWLGKVANCSDLFQQVATDFGICCSFNILPPPLLLRYISKNYHGNPDHLRDWEESNVNSDNLIFESKHKNRKKPHRQVYAGRSAGLSFLVDPELHEYHCSNTDSEGFVVGLSPPMDYPRMKDNGIAIRTSSEVFISATPELTMIDDSAKGFNFEHRQCYLHGEMKLEYYTRYTASNCMDECISKRTMAECKCLRYYMPSKQNFTEVACGTIEEYECTERIREDILEKGFDQQCAHCWPTCTELLYHAESTSLRVQEKAIKLLLKDKHPNPEKVRNASIVHIYLNVDSVFPRLRKEMYSVIDLISNAGGLLGLCMGLSFLSVLEIIYHLTLRLICNKYRKRIFEQPETIEANSNSKRIFHSGIPIPNWRSDIKVQEFTTENEKNDGFLSKLLKHQQGTIVQNIQHEQESNIPAYFRTSFESDFKRAYISTTAWHPDQLA